ncbi:MAG: general secretion pathway protein GspK [Hyphomicrobium sp.]|uniref:general secretion pathway protein GspK n=1 Tax=Hyphomicrobium sp. TaxID=82 RepID=UPI003D109315
MPETSEASFTEESDSGFVLLAVLLVSLILIAVTSALTTTVRGRLEIARAVAGSAEAEALADAGAHIAMLDIDDARRNGGGARRFPIGGAPVSCIAPNGKGTITIEVRDEAGKININSRNEQLLLAFVSGLGVDGETAQLLISRVFDYRDGDQVTREGEAEAGVEIASDAFSGGRFKNRPFDVIEELAQVPGFPHAATAAALPYLTVYSDVDGFDPALAPSGLANLISEGAARTGLASTASSEDLPLPFIARSTQRALAIVATASLPSGTRYTREAIVKVSASGGGYVVRRWIQAPYALAPSGEGTLPPC